MRIQRCGFGGRGGGVSSEGKGFEVSKIHAIPRVLCVLPEDQDVNFQLFLPPWT